MNILCQIVTTNAENYLRNLSFAALERLPSFTAADPSEPRYSELSPIVYSRGSDVP